MSVQTLLRLVLIVAIVALPGISGGKDDLKQYFNTTAANVKATENSAEKRAILKRSLENMTNALETVQQYPLVSDNDKSGIKKLSASLAEKQDELEGRNGYKRVADANMDDFADYVVQDFEQAEVISISLLTLVLIIILVVLIVK